MENDLSSVRALVRKTAVKSVVSIKGMLKGITVTDNDIKEAKGSLFKHSHS